MIVCFMSSCIYQRSSWATNLALRWPLTFIVLKQSNVPKSLCRTPPTKIDLWAPNIKVSWFLKSFMVSTRPQWNSCPCRQHAYAPLTPIPLSQLVAFSNSIPPNLQLSSPSPLNTMVLLFPRGIFFSSTRDFTSHMCTFDRFRHYLAGHLSLTFLFYPRNLCQRS